ncbi:MAG TPA: M48 family metalloprotease [Patescibacteria group bacterium]|nr:M48 family metalloprotease [Patescibacteria group bacterium]
MNEEMKKIYRAFGGKLIGDSFMKRQVCQVVLKMPQDLQRKITSGCFFIASMDDAWAFAFDGRELVGKHLVFLSEDLLSQDTDQIQYTIAHEIGHVVLGHKNSILVRQTRTEIRKQEEDADKFARQFVSIS